ncbi:MAG TPA: NADH:flavin oxidoreductase [Polyangiales bacterium]|nr:NADH:flavin oxidoreductase [Polyangiales bacterium]
MQIDPAVAPLFKRFQLRDLTLSNRIVMAPMTRSHSPEGQPTQAVVDYYRRRAEHGVGLIITEGTTIDHPVATGDPNVPRFHGELSLSGWRRVLEAVHGAGGRIFPQLWHVGSTRRPGTLPHPDQQSVGPSGLIAPGKKKVREMTERDIADVIEAYATGARSARELGFDGVELHGAHGYLIDQFFWEGLNVREDSWGGSLLGRTRFGSEVVRAVRRAVGPDFPIGLRYSQWKPHDYNAKLARDPSELEAFLAPLVDAGVDIFHASTRRFWLPEFEGSELNLAGWTKKLSGKPVITVGSVGLDQEFIGAFVGVGAQTRGLEELVARIEREEFDLVAVGRALLQDAQWAQKVREGRHTEIRAFDAASLKQLQ